MIRRFADFRQALLVLSPLITVLGGCWVTHPQIGKTCSFQVNPAEPPLYSARPLHSAMPADRSDPVIPARSVDEYVALALARNPQIQAAKHQVEAAWWKLPQERSLEDPTATLTAQPRPIETAAGAQRFAISVNQKLPWHGKLDARASRAAALARQAETDAAAVTLEVIQRVKSAYFELYRIDQVIAVVRQRQEILAELIEIAEAQFRTGDVSKQDILRLEVELAEKEADLISLRQARVATSATLAKLLAAPPDAQLQTQPKLELVSLEHDLNSLRAMARAARPELKGQLAALSAARHSARLAQLNRYPDVTLGLLWLAVDDQGLSGIANGQDALLLSAGMNLPVYRTRLEAGIQEAHSQSAAAARRYEAIRDQTDEQITQLWSEAKSQHELIVLFQEQLIPRADETFELSIQAYQVGEVDVLQVLRNMQELLGYKTTVAELIARNRQTMARLERILGGRLPVAEEGAKPANSQESQESETPEESDKKTKTQPMS